MPKETINTTNKFILPPNGDAGSEEARRQIVENLQKITPEQARAVGEELEQKMKEREQEANQSLLDFRKAWKEKIKDLSHDFRDNMDDILKKLDQIPVKVDVDKEDGSRLIEFRLGGKTWKILDPKLDSHTDQSDDYVYHANFDSITKGNQDYVRLKGMIGNNIGDWENKPLADYVRQKQGEGMRIATIEDFRGTENNEGLLSLLRKEAGLDDEEDQIAMLMYLTGMDGWYWLKDTSGSSRSVLFCSDIFRYFDYFSNDKLASLCLIACEGDEPTKSSTPKTKRGMFDFFRRVNDDPRNVYK